MRRTLLFLALLLAAACGRDAAAPGPAGTGSFLGVWDGALWAGRGYAVLEHDTLYLRGFRLDRSQSGEEVRVQVPFGGAGTYPVSTTQAQLAQIIGGDAGWFPPAGGELDVASVGETIRGGIDLTAEGPDGRTWRFRQGRFALPLYASFEEAHRSIW